METGWATTEMDGAHLWDQRRRRSLALLCARLAQQPTLSFSAACGPGLRQAAHRLFEHPGTTVGGLLAGHVGETATRCGAAACVLAVQDSTEFDYTSHPATTGLGPLGRGQGRGLLGHTVLAVTPTGLPLGLLHLSLWARDPAQRGQRHDRRQRATTQKESQKWLTGLQATEAALPPAQRVILIADREADVFAYLAAPRRSTTALLFRACHPRTVLVERPATGGDRERASLLAVAKSAPAVGQLRVTLPRQRGQPEREVRLELRLTAAQVQPPRHRKAGEPATPQAVWLIAATEIAPAAGAKPIHWLLVTTLAVESAAAAAQMVRYYACRWVIERWHYTLKVGLQVERLQIDDATSLQHALAVYGVVAWRLLWLTQLAREVPEQPAATVLGAAERAVLAQASGRPVETVRQAVRTIARLGGFAGSPSEGEPGVKSLWLGLRRLDAMVEGWRLAWQARSGDSGDMIHD
jgi:transposase Tn5 family protein/transposase-like protein